VLVLLAGTSCERAKDTPPPPPPAPPEPFDVVFAIDASKSMEDIDVAPDRYRAATEAIRGMVAADRRDRFAVVVFAQQVRLVAPLGRDAAALDTTLAKLRIGDVPDLGTALGDGLALAIDQLRASKPGHRAIVLLGDGDWNWVIRVEPDQAVADAKALAIPVFAVMIGDDKPDLFGGAADPTTFTRVATATGGRFHAARDRASLDRALAEVRRTLDTMAAH